MPDTFDDLCKQMKLTPTLQNQNQLDHLRVWCHKHVSQDCTYEGEPAVVYDGYFKLAKKYDIFLNQINEGFFNSSPHFDGMNAIQYAANQGFNYFISSQSFQPDTVNSSTSLGMTPLHLAAVQGHWHTLRALLQKGANPLQKNNNAQLPLHSACFVPYSHETHLVPQKIRIIRTLLDQVKDTLNEKDNAGETIFHLLATQEAFLPLLDELLTRHPEGAFYCNNHGQYPIHIAVLNNQIAIAERLLEIDKVALLADSKQRIALHHAARYGNAKMLTLCCKKTSDINLLDSEGKTPLLYAAEEGILENVKILIQYGAKLTLSDPFSRSILHYAALRGNAPLLEWILKQKQITLELINQKDVQANTPLELSQQYHHEGLVNMLITHGATPSNLPKNNK